MLVVEISRIGKEVLPANVAFLLWIEAVMKVITLKIQPGADDIIVIQTRAPSCIDTAVTASTEPICRRVIPTHINTKASAATSTLHSGKFTGEVENVHN